MNQHNARETEKISMINSAKQEINKNNERDEFQKEFQPFALLEL